MPSLGWRTSWWRTSVNIQNLFQPRTLPKPVCISEPVWTQNLVRTLNLIERTLPKPGRSGKRAAGWWASWLQNFSQNLTFAPSQNRVSHSWNFAPWKLTALWSFHDKYVTNGYLILSEVPWPNFADLFSYLFSKTSTIFFFLVIKEHVPKTRIGECAWRTLTPSSCLQSHQTHGQVMQMSTWPQRPCERLWKRRRAQNHPRWQRLNLRRTSAMWMQPSRWPLVWPWLWLAMWSGPRPLCQVLQRLFSQEFCQGLQPSQFSCMLVGVGLASPPKLPGFDYC